MSKGRLRHSSQSRSQSQQFWMLRYITALRRRPLRVAMIGLVVVMMGWVAGLTVQLHRAAQAPVDAFFVLGGSIQREIYVAELANQYPDVPILISQGSPDPCIWLIFDRAAAPMQQVLLEKCADSTFENYVFGFPVLHQWGTQHVQVITSKTHLPRAIWLAQIILGSHGIWVEPALAAEEGVPANQEAWWKTGLDVTRSVGWAIASQFYHPQCSRLQRLTAVDLAMWQQQGFHCERQGNLNMN